MGFTELIIKAAVKTPKIGDFDRFLFVGPHPDDIEIGAGATAAKLVKEGKKVTFVICTDGRFGDGASGGISGDELAALRKEEAVKSARVLGVTDVRFLGLSDGAMYGIDDLQKRIAEVIAEVKPDVVFAPDPLSKSECHMDHLNVGNAVRNVACFAPYKNLMNARYRTDCAQVKALALYMTARPNRFVRVRGMMKKQLDSIFDCHISQFPKDSEEAKSIKTYLRLRYFTYLGREGFRVYSQTHMHCLPEAK